MPVPSLAHALEDVPVAMGVCTLPEQTLVLMNDTALELVGWPRSEALGRRAGDLLTGSAQTPDGDAGLAALASGELTSYRADRCARRYDGSCVKISMWVRVLSTPRASYAFGVAVRTDQDHEATDAIARSFSPDATDLAVGMTDREGRIRQIIADGPRVLAGVHGGLAGATLFDLVHPDDAERLRKALRGAADDATDIAVAVRMRDEVRGWVRVRCAFFAGWHLEPEGLAFALAEPTGDDGTRTDDRAVELERHLMRIGAELQGSGLLGPGSEIHAPPKELAVLSDLPQRQREIVNRLLEGGRVPGISEEMNLSPATVRNHLTRVFEKFGVHSQADLIALLRKKLAAADG